MEIKIGFTCHNSSRRGNDGNDSVSLCLLAQKKTQAFEAGTHQKSGH